MQVRSHGVLEKVIVIKQMLLEEYIDFLQNCAKGAAIRAT